MAPIRASPLVRPVTGCARTVIGRYTESQILCSIPCERQYVSHYELYNHQESG